MRDYDNIDIQILKFFVDNNCSKGPLQNSFKLVEKSMEREYMIMEIGLASVILAFLFHLISNFWTVKREAYLLFCKNVDKNNKY
jgi:hypothetical protein